MKGRFSSLRVGTFCTRKSWVNSLQAAASSEKWGEIGVVLFDSREVVRQTSSEKLPRTEIKENRGILFESVGGVLAFAIRGCSS